MRHPNWILAALTLTAACGEEAAPAADAASDGAADAATDVSATTDTAADAGKDAKSCGALPSCLNEKGQEDFGLCKQKAADYHCKAGCCVAIEKCKSDADCFAKLGSEFCPDKRFTCGCSQETSQCTQTMCLVDAQCLTGQVCSQGGCIASPGAGDLHARLLRPYWLAVPQQSVKAADTLGAQALDDKGNVSPSAEFEWALQGEGFQLDGANLKATDKAGKATVTAKVKGSSKPASNPATLWNLGPPNKGELRVVAVDEAGLLALDAKVVAIGLADQATPAKAVEVDAKGGVATFPAPQGPVDLHVFAKDHQPVSILRHDPAVLDLVVPLPLYSYVDLQLHATGTIIEDESKLVHADVQTGELDYGSDSKTALGLTSLAFGPALLNFNLDAILGPQVKRPFNDKAPGILNPTPGKPQDIPGGVTFLFGTPVVTQYVVAGAPGKHTLWSLAGPLDFNEILTQSGKLVDTFTDGVNIGQVVGVLLPYLAGFSSYVEHDVAFANSASNPPKVRAKFTPLFPLGHRVDVAVAVLPTTGDATYADLVFAIAGALLPAGEIVPLGLTAASDTNEKGEKPDGKIDADLKTPELDPLRLAVGPLHTGLRVGAANHVVVEAAVILGGKGKKEGGSIVILPPGELPAKLDPQPFLPFPLGAKYDPATATLTMVPVAGAQFYRATLSGPDGQQWVVVLPGSLAGKAVKLADLTLFGGPWNLAAAPKRVMLGAFELHAAAPWQELVGPQGLTDLVRRTKRTSFLDVAP
jgi:hypothetical protein